MKGHARNLMTERVSAVPPDATLDLVARTLVAGRFGGVPVVSPEGEVLGIVTQTDLIAALLRGATPETTAADIMSRPPIVVDEFATSDDVMGLLRESEIHHLPVVREGRLVGIITPQDVLRFLVEQVLPQPPEAG